MRPSQRECQRSAREPTACRRALGSRSLSPLIDLQVAVRFPGTADARKPLGELERLLKAASGAVADVAVGAQPFDAVPASLDPDADPGANRDPIGWHVVGIEIVGTLAYTDVEADASVLPLAFPREV